MGEPGIGFHQLLQLMAGRPFHGKLCFTDFFLHGNHIGLGALHLVIKGIIAVYVLILGKIAEGFALGERYKPLIRGKLPHNNAQQSGFSGAVDSHNCGFFVILNMKGYAF